MAKTLCDLKRKDIEKDPKALAESILPAHFLCLKCARLANDKKLLCRPKKIA